MTVPSPCIKLCLLDPATRICTGCHRSLDEIGRWSAMTDAERRAVLARIKAENPARAGG